MTKTIDQRHEWNAAIHQAHLETPGVVHDPTAGTFAEPEQLVPVVEDAQTQLALRKIIGQGLQVDGTYAPLVQALGASPNWNSLVGEKRDVHSEPVVTDFLEQRAQEVGKASPVIRERYAEITQIVEDGVRKGIAEGYIPASVADRLDTLKLTVVQVVDYQLLQDDDFKTWGAYGPDDRLQVAHDISIDPLVLTAHEIIHKLSGGTFRLGDDPSRTRIGFVDDKGIHIGLTEAVSQHVALGVISGDFATLDPDKRADGDRMYYAQRKVVADAVEKSAGELEARTFTNALFEDTDTTQPTFQDRRELAIRMRQSYGPGSLRKLDALLARAALIDGEDPTYTKQLQALMSRIHPPGIDENGVMQPGFIDIENLLM